MLVLVLVLVVMVMVMVMVMLVLVLVLVIVFMPAILSRGRRRGWRTVCRRAASSRSGRRRA
jgi:ABC-type multidrug transport system fused ATPase/permease subunit